MSTTTATSTSLKGVKKIKKAVSSRLLPVRVPATIFLPTLLPDPFGESSPELCWEWSEHQSRVALRLTQFGWTASAFVEGSAIAHWSADTLADLRDNLCSSVGIDLPQAFSEPMRARWALAYEVAGF